MTMIPIRICKIGNHPSHSKCPVPRTNSRMLRMSHSTKFHIPSMYINTQLFAHFHVYYIKHFVYNEQQTETYKRYIHYLYTRIAFSLSYFENSHKNKKKTDGCVWALYKHTRADENY